MKCPSCDNELVIKTDPENRTYTFAEGIRKMEHDYEADAAVDAVPILDNNDEARLKEMQDPIFRLQHDTDMLVKSQTSRERIESLIDNRERLCRDDADRNSALRRINREKRLREQSLRDEGKKRRLSIPLAAEREEDATAARVHFQMRPHSGRQTEKMRISELRSSSIFAGSSAYRPQTCASAERTRSSIAAKCASRSLAKSVDAFSSSPSQVMSRCDVVSTVKRKSNPNLTPKPLT